MFGKTWKTSERKYRVVVERDVRIPMRDRIEISADLFRPDSHERFPAIFGFHPYRQESHDGGEVINWIAKQPWCDGNVGMFGVSYFAWIQMFIASLNPPNLKCIF